jgi:hypothetical protein
MILFLFASLVALAGAAQVDVDKHVGQARLYAKKGWHEEAMEELQEALQTDAGRASFELHALAARVSYSLWDAEAAIRFAGHAADLTPDAAQAASMRQFHDYLDRTFGVLLVLGPYDGMTTGLEVERTTPLLDPRLKEWNNSLAEQLRKRQVLPRRVSLPTGVYRVNGLEVGVEAGKVTQLQLPMGALNARGLAALQVSRMEVATGVGVIFSERLANLRPSLDVQVGVLQPVGKFLLGAQTTWSARSYTVLGDRPVRNPYTYTLGVSLGRELLLGGPLVIRPAIGIRYGFLPGVSLACSQIVGVEPESYECEDPNQERDWDPELYVYAISRVQLPFAELSLETRRTGATSAVGLGMKLVVEPLWGNLPSPAQANVGVDASPVDYVTLEDTFRGTSIRILAHTAIAF